MIREYNMLKLVRFSSDRSDTLVLGQKVNYFARWLETRKPVMIASDGLSMWLFR